jgi:hypothetical protein
MAVPRIYAEITVTDELVRDADPLVLGANS